MAKKVLPKHQTKGVVKSTKTPFQSYVAKYPGSGSDTLTTPASRNTNFDDHNWDKKSSKQKTDLSKAFGKTYSNYDSKAKNFRDSDGDMGGPGVRKKKGGAVKKMATGGITKNKTLYPAGAGLMKKGGPTALKKAISDSTKADKDYSYAKQYPKDFSGSGSKAKYIEDLQTKMEAPGKIRKQIAKSKKK